MLQQASTAWVGSRFLGGPNSGYPFDILLTNARHSLLTYGKIYVSRVNNTPASKKIRHDLNYYATLMHANSFTKYMLIFFLIAMKRF